MHSLQVKLDAEHTAGSSLSLVKCVPVLQDTALHSAAGALSGQDFSLYGEGEVPCKELGF